MGVSGDSQMFIAEFGHGLEYPDADQHLSDALVLNGNQVSMSAMIGATTGDLATQPPWPAPAPEILVIGLGTNDVHINPNTGQVTTTPAQALANVEAYVAANPSDCLVLIGTVETEPWGMHIHGVEYNNIVESFAVQNGHVFVDWAAEVDQNPGYVVSDGVHQTELGAEAYRTVIVGGVNAC